MSIQIGEFTKVTGWQVNDIGTQKGYLDAKDEITAGGAKISYETAVEAYYKMQSAKPSDPDKVEKPPVWEATRQWEIGRALFPGRIIRELRRSAYDWPSLTIRIDDLGGWLSKTVVLHVEGPKDILQDYLRAVDEFMAQFR